MESQLGEECIVEQEKKPTNSLVTSHQGDTVIQEQKNREEKIVESLKNSQTEKNILTAFCG